MPRPCENVYFCLFCQCAYLHNGEDWDCDREACVVNKTIVDWWEMSLKPHPLITSNPPSGMHQVYNIYTEKVGSKYELRLVVETTPKE